MTKKLFSLLTLLLLLCTSAWAECGDLCYFNSVTASSTKNSFAVSDVSAATTAGGHTTFTMNTGTASAAKYYAKLIPFNADTLKKQLFKGVNACYSDTIYLCVTVNTSADLSFVRGSNENYYVVGKKNTSTNAFTAISRTQMLKETGSYKFESGYVYYIVSTTSSSNSVSEIRVYHKDANVEVTVSAWLEESLPAVYTVSFNAGDHGTYTGGDIAQTTPNTNITLPSLTTLETGYHFNGWYTTSLGGSKVGDAGSPYKPTANVTVYAQYSQTFTVTYYGNGNTGGDVPVDDDSPYVSGSTVTVLGNTEGLENTGYGFAGWNTQDDGNGTTYQPNETFSISENTRFYAQWEELEAPTKPSVDGIPSADGIDKNTAVTLTASSDGIPTPTYAWYTCDANGENLSAEPIATTAAYSPSTSAMGTSYYCVIASNTEGDSQSDAIKVKVNGSNKCQLISILFSNTAYGAITEPVEEVLYTEDDDEVKAGTKNAGDVKVAAANGTVTVPYMKGQSAPTISAREISEAATYDLAGSVITLTSEDGTKTAVYDITTQEITPLSVSGDIDVTAFDAVPSWAFNPYGYDASKGVKFAKDVNDASNMRISKGFTRQYYFIEAAQTLTLTSGSGGNRGIKVYRNGVKLDTPTATGAKDATIDIALNPSAPCMIVIESSGNNGDGGFTKYAVTANTNVTATIGATGWTTFSSNYALDLSEMTAAHTVAAYYAYDAEGTSVKVRTTTATVPVGEGLLLKGTAGDAVTIPVVASGTEIDGNLLEGCTTSTVLTANAAHYVLVNNGGTAEFQSLEDNGATIPAGKAYLNLSGVSLAPGALRIVEEENQATSIEALDATENAVKFIQDGKLFIKKNNVVYDMMGTVVR